MISVALLVIAGLPAQETYAQDSVCARVKMEVAQELTLERQAFDAHMRIHNGLDLISLENVGVVVNFLDKDGKAVRASSDPNDTSALFFIRLSSLENINRVDGLGTVSPKTSADIHWLIIPAPGASHGVEAGTLYYVGATLSYTLGGEGHSTTVSPDYIFVKPMPEMALDYFLPGDVYGDDPFTAETEPPVPFSLGVRIQNNGTGTARNVKIDSAQPKIVENAQGLLINFAITGSEVNGGGAAKSLLADFGDIAPGACATGRWTMTCSLSGKFVEFDADFSHADELGGELTSLIDSLTTHLLVRDVLVDLSGRDGIRDFLAEDGGVYRVYESDGVDTVVLDQSGSSTLEHLSQTGSLSTYSLSTTPTAGFFLVQLPDPNGGAKVLKEVLRSDGKRIKPENCWISSTRASAGTVRHTLSLFDASSTGSYRIVFDDPGFESKPPIIDSILDQTGVEGVELTFPVTATDPDGTLPALSATPLPAKAVFADLGSGHGVFSWIPAAGQAGRYEITFTASDGELKSSLRAVVTICSADDSDCDGMSDSWELLHFGSLERDGKGDLDCDGVTDFDEFWRGTDPTKSNAPSTPEIVSPLEKAEVTVLRPEITIRNSADPDPQDVVTYVFELYTEPAMTNLTASAQGLAGAGDATTWTVPDPLHENMHYFFRVRATDGRNFSQWAYGSFFVNTANDAPSDFNASSPKNGAESDSLTPALQVTNSTDPDGDILTYRFEVHGDETLSTLIASASDVPEGEDGTTSWTVDAPLQNHRSYLWRVTATDEHGAASSTPLNRFLVNVENRAPLTPAIVSPPEAGEVASRSIELVLSNSIDPDGDMLTYTFEVDTVNTFDGAELMSSSAIPEGEAVTGWTVSGLSDNTEYFFRARAEDGAAHSPWVQGSFFVNTENDAPDAPTVRNPGDAAWVETLTPSLELNPSLDTDRDRVTYRFELYGDPAHSHLIARGDSDSPRWTVPVELSDNGSYHWRAKAVDEHGAESDWTPPCSFFVNNNGVDDPPRMAFAAPAKDIFAGSKHVAIEWTDDDPDSNADISLYYSKNSSGPDRTAIAEGLKEDPDGPGDTLSWDTSVVPEGTYRIHGTIDDGVTSRSCVAPGKVTVDRTPPVVQAQPAGGTFESPRAVALSSSEAADVYYTLDGTEPTGLSPRYTKPLEIDSTATLRFMAVDPAGNHSAPYSETYTINPGFRVERFSVQAPSRVEAGLGFKLTIKALSQSGRVVKDFDGRVPLSSSTGTLSPGAAEGFSGGVWQGEASISGAEGPLIITASWNGATGTSRPITVRCDKPRAPVLSRPRDGAKLEDGVLSFSWHASRGAASYSIELARDAEFADIVHREESIASTSFNPPAALVEGLDAGETIYWRVGSANSCGVGSYGRARRFVYGRKLDSTLTLLSPARGESIRSGSDCTIAWDYTGAPGRTVKLSFKSAGSSWTLVASGISAESRAFAWTAPDRRAGGCQLKIESEQDPECSAVSTKFAIR